MLAFVTAFHGLSLIAQTVDPTAFGVTEFMVPGAIAAVAIYGFVTERKRSDRKDEVIAELIPALTRSNDLAQQSHTVLAATTQALDKVADSFTHVPATEELVRVRVALEAAEARERRWEQATGGRSASPPPS